MKLIPISESGMTPETVKVIEAWVNTGVNETYHREMQNKLRREWPVLANALDEIVRVQIVKANRREN